MKPQITQILADLGACYRTQDCQNRKAGAPRWATEDDDA